MTFSQNGNILSPSRYSKTTASAYNPTDNLVLTYSGNQLTNVTDAGTTVTLPESNDLKKGSTANPGYAYDKNGNMTKDLNKKITSITYNSLSLPQSLTIDGVTHTYTYAADGTKLRVKQGSMERTYAGSFIYEGSSLKRILIDGGYIEGNTYYFYLNDHLGNVRTVANAGGTPVQCNHYYPFGLPMAETENAEQEKQPYKYNGKEFERKNGLNWMDYGARHYDTALGRFTTMDRFAEKYYSMSPYQYGANNPMSCIDINGDSIIVDNQNLKDFVSAVYNGLEEGTNLKMKFNNGTLDPASIQKQAQNSNDFFLQDLYEIATNEKKVEVLFSDNNTYLRNKKLTKESFNVPMDDNSADFGPDYEKRLSAMGGSLGRGISGNLGQTLVPNNGLMSGKRSTNDNVQVIINRKGSLNHRTVGLAHEFAHVILYLRDKPFGHTQPGVDDFVYGRASQMSKRLGYDY